MVLDTDTLRCLEEERLPEAPFGARLPWRGQADLLLDAHIQTQARLPQLQDPPEAGQLRVGDVCADKADSWPGEREAPRQRRDISL